MFRYGHSNFTWNGTLRDLEAGSQASCGGRSRSNMSAAAASSSSGLEVLISSLQNVGDIESTLNVLNVLDELLSAGSDRRIHYMISKGGSQALLAALVKTARCLNPNYTVLVRLLHLLAKLGCRDRRIGLKAEDADAVLLTLNVLKQNSTHARISAACLMVLQVFCSSVTAANLLGEHRGLDAVYRLIPPRSGRHLTAIKAAIDALAALLCTKANVRSAVAKGYVSGLLTLYESWHVGDASHRAVGVRLALLRCLHQLAHSAAGREAVAAQGGLRLLFHTSQACLLSQSTESLVEPSVQLMRRCHPKIPLPLRSDRSAYSFPLPGGEDGPALASGNTAECGGEESEDEDAEDESPGERQQGLYLNKLRSRPDPDRPAELLAQYSQFFPELTHDFQELDSGSEETSSSSSAASYSSSSSSSSDEEAFLRSGSPPAPQRVGSDGRMTGSQETAGAAPPVAQLEPRDFQSRGYICSNHWRRTQGKDKTKERASSQRGGAGGEETGTQKEKEKEEKEEEEEEEEEEEDEKQQQQQQQQQSSLVERLLASHGARVPHHDPQLYRAAAALTRSIPGFSILAFPDFWGHLPPTGPEPMAPRKPGVQRQKVFEDVQRLFGEDIINQVVFDLEDTGPQCVNDRPDTLRFFSKFESGNLRKAVQVRRYEYDLVLNADANCSMNTQWFYFEVSNMVAGAPYRFNVINCEKTNSQFNYGMQPVLYSVREALDGRPHWVRSGTEICYYRNHFRPLNGKRGQTFYTLTFTVTFKHNEDVCYLAFHYPYTYSALQAHLQVLERSLDPTKVFFRQQPLCGSLAGNPCPLVTITACPASRGWRDMHQLRNRPCLVLTARVHPSESNASWVMRGTLEFLCSRDPVAQSLREAFVFKIIPMLNPDGVINGTHRCALNGEDLNRQWSRPSAVLSPTVYHAKGLLYYLTSTGRTPLVFCDYHGHSRKKNVFLYGCSVKETLWQSGSAVDTVGLKEDPGYRTIPKTLDRIAPAFSFNSCNYLVEKSRSATARVVVWREMGVLRSYTMESTYNGCDQGIYKGLQTGTRELEEMGVKFCHSLLSLRRDVTVLCSSRALINHVHLDSNVLDHKSHNCFEDDEPPCPEEIEYSAYSCPAPSGAQLDLDIDKNSSSSSSSSSSTSEEEEEEEGGEEGKEKEKEGQGRVKTSRRSGGSCLKSRLFPRLLSKGSMETLHLKRSQWFQDTV